MKGVKKILVPVDFSDCSKNAFSHALDIARENKATIFLLHVIDVELIENLSSLGLCPKGDIRKRMEKSAKDGFDLMLSEVGRGKKGVSIREIVEEGIPFIQILKKTKDMEIDLIVMGSFGTSSPMRRLLFGSTVELVLRGVRTPVLCVPLPEAIEG
ncbi:MAG: universal stress protein [Deltaproteobacteria bacterium]|nr:universal stress protein [Deltaproteobacteria bacterium]